MSYERLLEITKGLSFLGLPIGVYVVALDGRLIDANVNAREILELPLEGPIEDSILRFYKDSADRLDLPEKLGEAEAVGEYLVSQLTFVVGSKEIHIREHARSIKDPVTQEYLGYLCCMMDITNEVRYRETFNVLPIGIYALDSEDRIDRVNEAFAELFGYETPYDLIGKHIQEFYFDPEEASEFRAELEKKGELKDSIVQVIKQNKERIYVRMSAKKLTSLTGEYSGREGTVMEADKERYKRILEVAPIGLFEVQTQDGKDRIVHCNDQFITINEFRDQQQATHYDWKKLHAYREDYKNFVEKLEKNNGQLLDEEVRIRTPRDDRDNDEKVVRVSVRATKDRNHRMTGYIGVVRDVTELKHRIEELTDDIGQVLHSYSAALMEIKQSSDALIDSMLPNPFESRDNVSPELALQALDEPVKRLLVMLYRLLVLVSSQERETTLLAEKRDDLIRLTDMFENYEKEIPYVELRPAALREATHELLTVCEEIRDEKLPRELIRQTMSQAHELTRILNLFTLQRMRDLTFEMGHPVRALREFVILGERVKQTKSPHNITALISHAINNIREFAHSRGVKFRRNIESPGALVNVVERDVIRALANILHNAIKYSWARANVGSTWVLIHAHQVDDMIHIEIENYGVPIPKDEIKELIFELGFRGTMSSERGRTGTGVGLADALRVAQESGGNITAESHPAVASRRDDEYDYSQPFLTKVTLLLPVYHVGGRHEA